MRKQNHPELGGLYRRLQELPAQEDDCFWCCVGSVFVMIQNSLLWDDQEYGYIEGTFKA